MNPRDFSGHITFVSTNETSFLCVARGCGSMRATHASTRRDEGARIAHGYCDVSCEGRASESGELLLSLVAFGMARLAVHKNACYSGQWLFERGTLRYRACCSIRRALIAVLGRTEIATRSGSFTSGPRMKIRLFCVRYGDNVPWCVSPETD